MAFSIESRLPFMDWRLVEYALSLPADFKIVGSWSKYVLRQALANVIPEQIRWRPDKMGFTQPEAVWLKRIQPSIEDVLTNSVHVTQWLDTTLLVKDIARFLGNQTQKTRLWKTGILWRAICFEIWADEMRKLHRDNQHVV